jgi:hypothetical protein
MPGPEATLERRCVKAAKAAGGELIKMLPWAVRGLPDRLLIMPGGLHTWIEFKAPDGRLTPLQRYWYVRLENLGCEYAVVTTWEEFERLLKDVQ